MELAIALICSPRLRCISRFARVQNITRFTPRVESSRRCSSVTNAMADIKSTTSGDDTGKGAGEKITESSISRDKVDIPLEQTDLLVDISNGYQPSHNNGAPHVEQPGVKSLGAVPPLKAHDSPFASISEGLATIRIPIQKPNAPKGEDGDIHNHNEGTIPSVFYNPIQQFNRDLSVLAIRVYAENLNLERKLQLEKRSFRDGRSIKRGKKRKREDVNGETLPAISLFPPDVPKQIHLDSLLEEVVPDNWEFGRQVGPKEVAYPRPEPGIKRTKGYCIRSYLRKFLPEHEDIRLKLWEQPVILKGDKFEIEEDSELVKVGRVQLCSGTRSLFRLRILDALSASGLRAIRYAKELPAVTQIVANDVSASAVSAIQGNVVFNNVKPLVGTSRANAQTVMYEAAAASVPGSNDSLFHVIDLDPYGSAASFLDSAVQALADGGLLCVTCTDAGIFASTAYLEKAFSQYSGLPVKGAYSHEAGLRIILNAIATSAARYGIAIEPLLSLSIDFYARLFVRVRKSPVEVKLLAGKTMIIYNCDHGCGAWKTQHLARSKAFENSKGATLYKYSLGTVTAAGPFCEHCGFKTHIAGPMWGGPIHNPAFVQKILDTLPHVDPKVYATIPRIEGMLTLARDEALLDDATLPAGSDPGTTTLSTDPPDMTKTPFAPLPPATLLNHPFFVIPSHLARTLHAQAPSDAQFRGALRHLGYRCTGSHCKPGSIVTDAPWDVIWEIMREWARKSKAKVNSLKSGTAGAEIWKRGLVNGLEAGCEEEKPKDDVSGNSASVFDERKLELKEITSRASDPEALRTQLEAFLYRLDPNQHRSLSTTNRTGAFNSKTTDDQGEDSTSLPRLPSPQSSQSVPCADSKEPVAESAIEIEETPLAAARRKGIVFDEKLGADPPKNGKVRYQMNPRPEWGPMSKAKMY